MRAAQRILRVLPEVRHSTQRLTRSSMVRAVSEVVQRKIRGAMSEKEMSDAPKRTTQPSGPTPVDEFFDELRKLTEEDMSSKESWTTEFPTKLGYYWIKNLSVWVTNSSWTKPNPHPTIVYLTRSGFGPKAPLQVLFIGTDSIKLKEQIHSAEWQGPIQMQE